MSGPVPPEIAIVGMACRYPDAAGPDELWNNTLARRRAFRRIPDVRLPLRDYGSSDPADVDRTYATHAAVIEGYEFDRLSYRVGAPAFREVDMAHWLALDVAARAITDAGLEGDRQPPRDTTGVIVGNTLTGEFSRANLLRLRWPYVGRLLRHHLTREGWGGAPRSELLARIEHDYKRSFPAMGSESLAGGLSNTIAGRICNHFDFRGGGYTVDGACAASLLAVTTACASLVSGDLDVAIAGGVDLSLDPFELVGFARLGALAKDNMRVYDQRSEGFWPGEGCGFVVLTRLQDALALGLRSYAVIRGWGISSDGRGGITRPEAAGQRLALERAYRRAGFGIASVAYFEGHGTGTRVGDQVEVQALLEARGAGGERPVPATLGSIKANIGHTKAAAGIAGLIKAALAIHERVLPPTTGCERPLAELTDGAHLTVTDEAEAWPGDRPLRAGVSASGFGGTNSHLALEGVAAEPRRRPTVKLEARACEQDCEVFLLAASTGEALLSQVDLLASIAPALAMAELADVAAATQHRLEPAPLRAAVVAATPAALAAGLGQLRIAVREMRTAGRIAPGVHLSRADTPPRVGFLFPGQGAPADVAGGLLRRRFREARLIYEGAALAAGADPVDTAVVQPAVVTASTAMLRVLRELGIEAGIAAGHSIGELTAYHWAGAMSWEALLATARLRGQAMSRLGGPPGSMASIMAPVSEVDGLIADGATIACLNGPDQTVVSGAADAVERLMNRARTAGLRASPLRVSHAFHSDLMAPVGPILAEHLATLHLGRLDRPVVSTVTGRRLPREADLRGLMVNQLTRPVRFADALEEMRTAADLLVEVGPGSVLTRLVEGWLPLPVYPLDAGGPSLRGLMELVAALHVWGAPLCHDRLFEGRHLKPFDLERPLRFLINPCESRADGDSGAETADEQTTDSPRARVPAAGQPSAEPLPPAGARDPLRVLRELVCERTELPTAAVLDHHRFLGDLHLNSITVAELMVESAARLGAQPPGSVLDFADATLAEAADVLRQLPTSRSRDGLPPAGVEDWVRIFSVEMDQESAPPPPSHSLQAGRWELEAIGDHPLRTALERILPELAGSGLLLAVDREHTLSLARRMLAAGRAATTSRPIVFVQDRMAGGASGFARSLHLEMPGADVKIVGVPFDDTRAASWIAAEARSVTGFTEVQYDETGSRLVPVLHVIEAPPTPPTPALEASDVLLVTGGGRGIGAECALSLAGATGCRVALLGRSDPAADAELGANLARFAAAGADFRYLVADVTDRPALEAAIHHAEIELGPVTGLLHAAGANRPVPLAKMLESELVAVLGPKMTGLDNLLASLEHRHLKLVLGFGSVIARSGLAGEAHYALANDWMRIRIERHRADHPDCRSICAEWSVWSRVGMGERLSTVDLLRRRGVTPITPEQGLAALPRVLALSATHPAVVISGRLGGLPTVRFSNPELPFVRFLERPEVFYPGIELVAEAELGMATDPYLEDHTLGGEALLPAVMGLEAMAQVASALAGAGGPVIFERVEFARPVVIPRQGTRRVRLAAVLEESGVVNVALRSEATGFHADHFRGRCRFGGPHPVEGTRMEGWSPPAAGGLEPGRDLYGGLLFQSGRFQRIRRYQGLGARACSFELTPAPEQSWFAPHLPGRLLLGDPGARDAALHALQACLPHLVVLPAAAQEIRIQTLAEREQVLHVRAEERWSDGNSFLWDLEIRTAAGALVEEWIGLRLQKVEERAVQADWPLPLVSAYVERRFHEALPNRRLWVELSRESPERGPSPKLASRGAGGRTVLRRSDGKPEPVRGRHLSASRSSGLSLAVAADAPAGCDLQLVAARPASEWAGLLGAEGLTLASAVAREIGEDLGPAATRVWAATEAAKKVGLGSTRALVLVTSPSPGIVILRCGPIGVVTLEVPGRGSDPPLIAAFAAGESDARL